MLEFKLVLLVGLLYFMLVFLFCLFLFNFFLIVFGSVCFCWFCWCIGFVIMLWCIEWLDGRGLYGNLILNDV